MRFITSFLSTLVFVICLPQLKCFAGEVFKISGGQLQPEISVHITSKQASQLHDHLQENAVKILTLHLVKGNAVADLPVAGKYVLNERTLSYKPLYPLGNGLVYEMHYHDGIEMIKQRLTMPPLPFSTDTAKVLSVFPITDTLPSNILFFHVRFTRPMADDQKAYTHVTLAGEDGIPIEQTWRQRSFWLDSMRLLVLMIHPGRVKTGIHYIGPVFEPGKKYTLTVSKEIKDINGHPIREPAVKQFTVANEDHDLPRVRSVSTTLKNGTKETMVVVFSEGMDHASLTDGLKIYNDRKEPVRCKVSQTGNDNIVLITPVEQWRKGRHKIVFENIVSDFSANRINRPFEIRELSEKEKDNIEVSSYFEVE